MRRVEARTYNQMGSSVSMVTSPGPPLSGGTYVCKFAQHKTNSYLYSDTFTPTASQYIHFGFYFRFGLQVNPSTAAGYIVIVGALADDNTSHWTIRLTRVDDSNHECTLHQAGGTEIASQSNPFVVDKWYRGEVLWTKGNSDSLTFNVWGLLGSVFGSRNTVFDVSGEDLESSSGSDVAMAFIGQGDDPLAFPTDYYLSQAYAIDDVDGDHQLFDNEGHVIKTYRPTKVSVEPDYDGTPPSGGAGDGDDLDGGTFSAAGDDAQLTDAEYSTGITNGCVNLDGPVGIGAGARFIGGSFLFHMGGVFGQPATVIDCVYGKKVPGSDDAVISVENTTITVNGFFRWLQDFNATSGHRLPNSLGYFVMGHGNRSVSSSYESNWKEGYAHMLMKYPIPASFVSIDGARYVTGPTGDKGRRVLIG
jgi:hypothetical protein